MYKLVGLRFTSKLDWSNRPPRLKEEAPTARLAHTPSNVQTFQLFALLTFVQASFERIKLDRNDSVIASAGV